MGKKLCHLCKLEGKKTPSVVYMKEHRLALCERHLTFWVQKRVKETIGEFKMLKPSERVLVAVSGGKDSQALWHILNALGYETEGFFIHLGIGDYSDESLQKAKELSQILGKKLHVVSLKEEIGAGIPELKKLVRGGACSICGRIKRYYFNLTAKRLGFNVVATGHNLDDESSSLLSNVLNWNVKYLARKYPVLPEEKGFPRKIKPLVKLSERIIKLYADINSIPYIERTCPLGDTAALHFYKNVMEEIENHSLGTKYRFYFEYLKRIYPIFSSLKGELLEGELQSCKVCGEPSPSEICLVCKLKERIKNSET
jgi:uncharacterized protein (TIGR00269 family)